MFIYQSLLSKNHHSFIWVARSWHYKPCCVSRLWRNAAAAVPGAVWGIHESVRVQCLIKAKSPVWCVLKSLGVRHRTDVIDEHVTRPLVYTFSRVSHNIPLHHLAEQSWPKLSGATVLVMDLKRGDKNLAASAHPSNMSNMKISQSSRRKHLLYLLFSTRFCCILVNLKPDLTSFENIFHT